MSKVKIEVDAEFAEAIKPLLEMCETMLGVKDSWSPPREPIQVYELVIPPEIAPDTITGVEFSKSGCVTVHYKIKPDPKREPKREPPKVDRPWKAAHCYYFGSDVWWATRNGAHINGFDVASYGPRAQEACEAFVDLANREEY